MQKASILTGSLNDRHRRILASKDSIDENQFKVNPILENNSSDVFSMADSLDIDGNSTPLHLRNDDELYSLGDSTTPPMNFEYDIDNPSRQQKIRSLFETASESERVAPEIRENILKNIEDKAPSVSTMLSQIKKPSTRQSVFWKRKERSRPKRRLNIKSQQTKT